MVRSKVTCAGGAWPICPTPPMETCNGNDDDCNGKIDDNLPVTPYLAEEDVTMKDSCNLAKLVTVTNAYVASGDTFQGYLYKSDGASDSDWFKFTTRELSSGVCTPLSEQCATTTFTLTEPTGKDYEFCVWYYELGTVSCGGGTKVCSTDAGQAKNKITVKYTGTCGLEDGIEYIMEVKPVTAATTSCKPYKVQMTWTTVDGVCP